MIIRSGPDELVLVTQPDHARLAGRLVSAWTDEALPSGSRRDLILLATAGHDEGWLDVDASPLVDPASGGLLDFVHTPDDIKHAIWPRGVQRFESTPYVAALVAQHALHVHERHRGDPQWQEFFVAIEEARDRHLSAVPSLGIDDLLADYFFVRIGDLVSLAFCNNWLEPLEESNCRIHWDGTS